MVKIEIILMVITITNDVIDQEREIPTINHNDNMKIITNE